MIVWPNDSNPFSLKILGQLNKISSYIFCFAPPRHKLRYFFYIPPLKFTLTKKVLVVKWVQPKFLGGPLTS